MNYPHDVNELIHWDTYRKRDSFGMYTVITGFEGTGRCFWCGDEIQGRRRFCGGNSGCWTRYQEHFGWSYAASVARKRANYSCENCGKHSIDIPPIGRYEKSGLEVHHIIPLNGKDRVIHVYNIFWNLICLCHDCHLLIHEAMRNPKELLASPDIFEIAVAKGQAVMEFAQQI